jgi:ribosomal protein L37AE/L43A
MGEHVFRFLLSELKAARLVCQKCGTVTEVPVDRLGPRHGGWHCPACQAPFYAAGAGDPVQQLAAVIQGLNGIKDKVQVEFLLPEK